MVRVELYDGRNKPATRAWNDSLQNRLRPITLAVIDGPTYTVEPADDGPASDYYAALPPGVYRMACNTEVGDTCLIRVEPRTVVYAGMLRINGKQTVPYDEYAQAAERFHARNPELADTLKKSLFRIYAYVPGDLAGTHGPYMKEQAWQGPAHKLP